MKPSILIVDDEDVSRLVLREALTKRGYQIEEASSAEDGIKKLRQQPFDLVLLDVQMSGMTGIEAIPKFKDIDPSVIIIMTTALGSKETIMEAISRGAYDYFVKPFKFEEMEVVVKRSLERRKMEVEIQTLREQVNQEFRVESIIGKSGAVQDILKLISRVAGTTATVLIWGETGTGKELVARAIHQNSSRQEKPMVKLNCAGIPEGLLESELFGFEKGAFTGAVERKIGKFELADQGTIFLDEIGDMNPGAQAKILRILQEMEFERLGGIKSIKIDVRVIAATNRDLTEAVKQGMFREDLFHRLNLFSIHMPSLRQRVEDIPILADHFLKEANKRFERSIGSISSEAMNYLMKYEWPGNVRELKNTIERSVLVTDGDVLSSKFLPQHVTRNVSEKTPASVPRLEMDLAETLRNVERQLILDALERADGVQRKAAKLLGITERVLWYKIKKLEIAVPGGSGDQFEAVEEVNEHEET
ncbi:MAG: sigma-54-dependent Fis family transcriptional regulator [Nitrospirae bacterium]|nr:MAG: sigma-54-dependent Fis family transcriptional regulator [Nitrospirota bacterium]